MLVKLFCLALLLAAAPAAALRTSGTVKDEVGLIFIGKFAFGVGRGSDGYAGNVSVQVTTKQSNLLLLVYDDQPDSWPAVYGTDLSCEKKLLAARESVLIGQGKSTALVKIAEKERPHFWYAIITPLQCEGNSSFSYEAHFVTADGWELGANDAGLPSMSMIFFLTWVALLAWVALRGGRAIMRIYCVRMFFLALALGCIAQFMRFVFYVSSNATGYEQLALRELSTLTLILSRVTFWFCIAAIATGLEIEHTSMIGAGTTRTSVGGGIGFAALCTYLLTWVFYATTTPPESTIFIFDTPIGIVSVVLHCFFFAWAMHTLATTYSSVTNEDKRKFLRDSGWLFTLWLVLFPMSVIVAALVSPWVRNTVVSATYDVCTTFVYASLAYLVRPSRCNAVFTADRLLAHRHRDRGPSVLMRDEDEA